MALENSSGRDVLTHYGPRSTDISNGGVRGTDVKTLKMSFTYDDLPVASATNGLLAFIPSGSTIVDCQVAATTAFAGGTSYDIGLEQQDGTDIDVDGLFDALVVANLTPAGDGSSALNHAGTNSGLLCGQQVQTDAYIIIAETGTHTAGAGEITIQYF